MPDWGNLTPEILCYIFEFTIQNEPDQLSYFLVCKNWNRVYTPLFYKSVTIDDSTQLRMFLNSMEAGKVGKFVREIEIRPVLYGEDSFRFIWRLATTCPNVDRLENPIDYYGPLMVLEDVCPRIWKLKCLPDCYSTVIDHYYAVALKLKDHLCSLTIWGYNPGSPSITNDLKHFTQLTHVRFGMGYNEYRQCLMIYDKVIERCPRLTTLDIEEQFPPDDQRILTTLRLSKIVPRPEIKELNVVITYHPGTLRYLINKFPKLTQLTFETNINLREPVSREFRRYCSKSSDTFVGYLHSIPDYTISIPCNEDLIEAYFRRCPQSTCRVKVHDEPYPRLVLTPDRATISCDKEELQHWCNILLSHVSLVCFNEAGENSQESVNMLDWCIALETLELPLTSLNDLTTLLQDKTCHRLKKLCVFTEIQDRRLVVPSFMFPSLSRLKVYRTGSYRVKTAFSVNLTGLSLDELEMKFEMDGQDTKTSKLIEIQIESDRSKIKYLVEDVSGRICYREWFPSSTARLQVIIRCSFLKTFAVTFGENVMYYIASLT
ncbi:hypothetical protein G6F37_007906 [Rhizopus arrhizus]|nr:hypothetical protein G6F38_005465 [Rhizopus arrhizus]KAG1156116.1 hypothetical protein G6F37_007906 [Rhizopus arrhizus]